VNAPWRVLKRSRGRGSGTLAQSDGVEQGCPVPVLVGGLLQQQLQQAAGDRMGGGNTDVKAAPSHRHPIVILPEGEGTDAGACVLVQYAELFNRPISTTFCQWLRFTPGVHYPFHPFPGPFCVPPPRPASVLPA
jgi:hypothetical protein